MTLAQLRAHLASLLTAARALPTKAETEKRALTADETKDLDAKLADIAATKANITRLETLETEERAAAKPNEPRHNPGQPGGEPDTTTDDAAKAKRLTVPAVARSTRAVRSFKGADAQVKAYRFGVYAAAMFGKPWAQRRAKELGIELRVQNEGDDNAGGVWVPDEFSNDIIDLRDAYGVFSTYAKYEKMTSDTKTIRRRTSGLTAYAVGESDAITQSTKGWNLVKLEAKKFGVLAKMTNELSEDSVINVGDDLANEMAYAFAQKADLAGFIGDGSSTYAGITGVNTKIKALSSTIAYIAGLVVGTGNLYSELVLADFAAVVAKLPQFADTPNARWFMHKSFYGSTVLPLMLAAGGNTVSNIAAGGLPRFCGYDIVFCNAMPKVEANSQVCALLGDLSLAAAYGDRRQTAIAMSDSALNSFEQDEIAIRGTTRFDVNVHDVGDANATATSRNPGPIVGLITAAS